MNRTEFKRYLAALLQETEPRIGGPATPELAAVVAEMKAHCYALELFDHALTLPDSDQCKTALTVCNQIQRTILALEAPQSDTGERDTLTPPELAGSLGVSPDTVLGWIRSKELKASNLNSFGKRPRWVIAKDDVNEFLKRRQPDPKRQREKKRRPRQDGVIEFF